MARSRSCNRSGKLASTTATEQFEFVSNPDEISKMVAGARNVSVL
jgi:hypothetical protein